MAGNFSSTGRRRQYSRGLRAGLRIGSAAIALSACAAADAAYAACSSVAPASGDTVTCDGNSTTGIIAGGSSNVTVNIQPNATVIPAAGNTINLGGGAHITIGTGSTIGNAGIENNYAVRMGDGATLTVDGKIQGRGGVTGAGSDSSTNFNGFAGAHVIIDQGGEVVTSGTGFNGALNGRGGGNTYTVNGTVRDLGASEGILVGAGDVLNLGATGQIVTVAGSSASDIFGLQTSGVTVTTAAGSLIELHGIGRGIQLGTAANVTLGGLIRSYGDAAITNSSGGVAVEVTAGSTVHLLQGAQIVTGNTGGLGNQGAGAIGISSSVPNVATNSQIFVDGLIDTQRAIGLSAGLDSITIGATGRVTTRAASAAISGNLYSTVASHTFTLDISGTVEQLGTGRALTLSGSRATGETVETTIQANVTVRQGATLFSQANLAYGELDGAGNFPEITDNLVIAGRVARGNGGTVIDLNDGADRITFLPTYQLTGNIDGGSDAGGPANPTETDTFALDGASGTSASFDFGANQIMNFEAGEKNGAGTWTLLGTTTGLNGNFAVNAGTLIVNGSLANTGAGVANGAALGGSGSLGGPVTVANGGILLGVAGATLGLGSLVLNDTSQIKVTLGAPSSTPLFNVAGALTLDGQLSVANAGGFAFGNYRLFNYGGALTNNGLVIGAAPVGFNPGNWSIDTSTSGQVSLVVVPGPNEQYWDGANLTPGGVANGRGGSGTWNAANTNWTNVAGTINAPWASQAAVFAAAGASTVTIEGPQTFTGLHFLAGANYTFAAGANGGLVTASGQAEVALDQSGGAAATVTIAAPIIGAGGINKAGGGTLTLTGTNAYAGNTTVSAGTLSVGSGGTLGSIAGNATVASGATFALNRSDAVTFAGVISGAGAFAKQGAGTLSLTGDSSAFTGTATVQAGVLALAGKLGGGLTVASGARLQGIGTAGAVTVAAGGTVAPGNSIGTLNVGSIGFTSGSTFEVEANSAGQSDRIVASGTAALNGGTVKVLAQDGTYTLSTQYTVLTAAGGITGTGFANITSNLAFLTPSLQQTANSLLLTLKRNTIDFDAIGGTFNERSAGRAVQTLGTGGVYNAVLSLDGPGARAAFDAISGEIHASLRTALLDDSRLPREAVLRRLESEPEGHLGMWGEGFGDWGKSYSDGNAAKLSQDSSGFVMGADLAGGDTWRLGLAGGYTHHTLDLPARASSARFNMVHALAYAGGSFGPVRIAFGAGYAHVDTKTDRIATFTGFSDAPTAHYDGSVVQGFAELGYRIPLGGGLAEPFAQAAVVRVATDAFTETGGAAALSGASSSETRAITTVGLHMATPVAGRLSVDGRIGWRHGFGHLTPLATLDLAGGTGFDIAGVPSSRDAGVAQLGLTFAATPNLSLSAHYSGVIGVSGDNQAVNGGIRLVF